MNEVTHMKSLYMVIMTSFITYHCARRGGVEWLRAVEVKMPRKVKMRREVGGGVEEFLDYLFPDDEKKMGELLSID